MPFKNLNRDAKLDWLSLGMAETMMADLKRAGGLKVVERDQISSAIAELKLQRAVGVEASTAVKVGRLAGARSVVLGGFQAAGRRIRITARFVEVETGIIKKTAKVTGSLSAIFRLQDELARRLLGVRLKSKKRPVKATGKLLKAYELFSKSLVANSDEQRIKYLRLALEQQPDFVYALEDLAKLEKRLKKYRKASDEVQRDRLARLERLLKDDKVPARQKTMTAMTLMGQLMGSRRYRTLYRMAGEILRAGLPSGGYADVNETAAYFRFLAAQQLKRKDEALRLGEAYLSAYPGGAYFAAVDQQLKLMIDAKRRQEQNRTEVAKVLAKIDEKKKKLQKKLVEGRGTPAAVAAQDFSACSKMLSMELYDLAIEKCERFVKEWRDSGLKEVAEWLVIAQVFQIRALAELGRFEEAKALAEKLMKSAPERARRAGLDGIMTTWPAD